MGTHGNQGFYQSIMDKRNIHIKKMDLSDVSDHGFLSSSMTDRLSYMWELTRSAWALVADQDAEQRLQRHVAVFARRKG